MKRITLLISGFFMAFICMGQGIPINNGFTVSAPRYVDLRAGKIVSGRSVPFASVAEANAATDTAFRAIGLIKVIDDGSGPKDYWYVGGRQNANLVLKNPSSYTFSNGLTNNTGVVGLGGALNANTEITGGMYSLNIGTNANRTFETYINASSTAELNAYNLAQYGVVSARAGWVQIASAKGAYSSMVLVDTFGVKFYKDGVLKAHIRDMPLTATTGYPVIIYDTVTKEFKRSYVAAGINIYNSDGRFTGNRIMNAGSQTLTLDSISLLQINALTAATVTSPQINLDAATTVATGSLYVDDVPNTTDTAKRVLVWDAGSHRFHTRYSSALVTGSGWGLTGSGGTTAGINFIGTTDDVALWFKTNNVKSGMIGTGATTHYNTGFGYEALLNTTSTLNSAFGYNALKTQVSGNSNTAIGFQTLKNTTNGSANTAVGHDAVGTNTTGSSNVGVGHDALYNGTTGSYNTGVGTDVLLTHTTGNYNTAVGYNAGATKETGSKNTYVGANSGLSAGTLTGSSNTVIGANVTITPLYASNRIIIADGDGNQRIQSDSLGLITLPAYAGSGNADSLVGMDTGGKLVKRFNTGAAKTYGGGITDSSNKVMLGSGNFYDNIALVGLGTKNLLAYSYTDASNNVLLRVGDGSNYTGSFTTSVPGLISIVGTSSAGARFYSQGTGGKYSSITANAGLTTIDIRDSIKIISTSGSALGPVTDTTNYKPLGISASGRVQQISYWPGSGGSSGTEVYNEPSTGFTGTSMSTTNTPTTGTLRLFKNGIRLVLGYDYTISGSTVTLAVAAISSDYFIKDYKY